MDNERRTRIPFPAWSKSFLAFSILVITGIAVSLSVTEQSTYVSVEEATSGKYSEGSSLQVHGTIIDLKANDCLLIDGNFSLKVDIYYRLRRLIDSKQMGDVFKVMFISNKKINFKLGF